MAGVVAMASVIEDFDTQSCKKPHKVSDPSSVKTITNYFSPLPKPMETHFSPPRSNNITSYFQRKAQPLREKGSTPEQTKENHLGPPPMKSPASVVSPVTRTVKPPQKRVRKPSKAARQLHVLAADAGSSHTEDCVFLDGTGDAEGSEDKAVSNSSGILGSDTAALLAQVSADIGVAGDTVDNNDIVCPEKAQKGKYLRVDSKKEDAAKKRESCDSYSPKRIRKDKRKCKKPAPEKKGLASAKATRRQEEGRDTHECVAEGQEADLSLCDGSMNISEESQLNASTVTISFRDFLQSQEEQVEDGSGVDPESEERDPDVSELPVLRVSPRTLTVQAEVHPVSPGHEPVQVPEKRLASIFSRGKERVPTAVEVKRDSSSCPRSTPELFPAHKRRSNVVLLEEDLELSVVEAESTPKCSQTERKQFMSAFKQPVKPGRGPAKPSVEAGGGTAVEETPSTVGPTQEQPGKKTATKKPPRRRRGKADEKAVPSAVTQDSPVSMETVDAVEIDARPEAEAATSTPHLRRSTREAPRRQVVNPSPQLRKTKTEKVKRLAAVSEDGQIQMSSPKVHRSKHRVFRAQMVCSPDQTSSPIRMKFTRVFPSAASESANGSGIASKESNASKKQKKAKKLVEKARAIQHSKKTAAHQEDQSSLRRSSRSQVSKKSYDKDSVICLEEESQDGSAQTGKQKGKSLKRSLNDVLGKKTPASKETKNAAASVFLGKKAQRTSVVSIFDDSSRDGSDNSQDDEKFRARREFLKSGLPESFKKQVAKTAATQEAYVASCSSFQPVVHVLQTPQGCPLWSLPWPDSPRLQGLQELPSLPSTLPPSLPSLTCFRTEPASRSHTKRGSGLRHELSEPVRELLMEEISASNPHFPVQRFLTRFLNRRADHLLQCTASEPGSQTPSDPASSQSVGGKRKRVDEIEVVLGKAAKKQKSSRSDEDKAIETPDPEPSRRGGRGRRCKKLQEEKEKDNAPVPSQHDPVILLEDSPLADSSVKDADVVKEDVLWTEKYQPQQTSDVIGNTASVKRLHSWLKEWKLRADREERKRQKEKKQEEESNDSWDTEEVDSQEGEELMCNTLLITGPTGVGKTAAVYACAQELGFKVFEVNASSQRNGRQILSQLKEATQSHQVDIQGVTSSKPCYFNSYSSTRSGPSPRKGNSPRRPVSSPRKPPQSPRSAKKGTLAPTSLANFFKMGRPSPLASQVKTQPTAASSRTSKGARSTKTTEPQMASPAPANNKGTCTPADEQSKKTATSLILFEEVDVIFEDDSGFLAAIKTFMTTTKRPVILTTSDPTFSTMFDGYFEEIIFKTPSMVNVASYLQLLCLAENTRVDTQDMSSLLQLNGCDIRQSLMGLQFWSRSTGAQHIPHPPSDSSPTDIQPTTLEEVEVSECGGVAPAKVLPPCNTGCTESILGLLNIEPPMGVLDLLKSTVEPSCWELLSSCRTRGVHLLYSNMEALLPLPTTPLTAHRHPSPDKPSADPQEVVSVNPETDSALRPCWRRSNLLSHASLQQAAEGSDADGSPVKLSTRMKSRKKQAGRTDRDPFLSDSDSDDAFLSLRHPPQSTPWVLEEGQGLARAGRKLCLTAEQKLKSRPISSCLGSLAEFLDHMSLLDSCLHLHASPPGGARCLGRMFGLRAPVGMKDGMTDEPSEEGNAGSWVVEERVGQIQTAVEALSFQRCRARVEEAWGEAQGLEEKLRKEAVMELTLPVASHRHGFRLTQESLCEPTALQKRTEVMDLLPTRVAGALGNRPAAALDFLPSLRTICRSEALKEQGKVKRRFLHYLNAIHLDFPKNTLQHLAEDFP